jgi:hypothetical protein
MGLTGVILLAYIMNEKVRGLNSLWVKIMNAFYLESRLA